MSLEKAKSILLSTASTIAVVSNGEVFTSQERGVKPLLHLLTEKKGFLKGASVADKVIGKAAALLMVLGEIKEVHTLIISEPAIKVFERCLRCRQSHREGSGAPHGIGRNQRGSHFDNLRTCNQSL